jgi:hypothetical protein
MDTKIQDVKEEGTEEVTQETPSAQEETTEEVSTPQETVESTEETQPEAVPTETVESPKKGAESRIRELNAEKKEALAKVQSLAQRLEEVTRIPQGMPESFPQPEPGSDISPAQYEADVTRKADSLITIRLKQQERINDIKSESLEAVRAYPELDPTSDSFDEKLSNTVTKATEAYIRSDPYKASVKGFVDELMEPYKRLVTKEVGQQTANLAKQVAETALRPTGVKTPVKANSDKTLEEMEAELGIINA